MIMQLQVNEEKLISMIMIMINIFYYLRFTTYFFSFVISSRNFSDNNKFLL